MSGQWFWEMTLNRTLHAVAVGFSPPPPLVYDNAPAKINRHVPLTSGAASALRERNVSADSSTSP